MQLYTAPLRGPVGPDTEDDSSPTPGQIQAPFTLLCQQSILRESRFRSRVQATGNLRKQDQARPCKRHSQPSHSCNAREVARFTNDERRKQSKERTTRENCKHSKDDNNDANNRKIRPAKSHPEKPSRKTRNSRYKAVKADWGPGKIQTLFSTEHS